ncbi:MAG: hypothetical protein K2Y23_19640 [Cyanobacteria bacterium]|nr:hypothetical protein [Cyanobacteriota bacterium]
MVSAAEIELYRKRNAIAWFRESDGEIAERDPFEAIPGAPGLQRIRKRDDGACGFLSADNRCRIHEEIGAAKKPLTCRLFPYAFHTAADGVVVTASFGCPTIVANQGASIAAGESLIAIESLRKEWLAGRQIKARSAELVNGRAIDTRTSRVLRENLLAMLKQESGDIRDDINRIAATLDDLTRSKVLTLADEDFAEYVSLTVPHAANKPDAVARREPGRIARALQYGFLYAVAAARADVEHRGESRMQLRIARLMVLAHFHGLAPAVDRVNVKALKRRAVDINSPGIRPIVFHYLRSTLETLGARGRPIVDELAMAVSFLNAACGLAAMNADDDDEDVDREIFSEALMEASDLSHADNALLDSILVRFSAGIDAFWHLSRPLRPQPR